MFMNMINSRDSTLWCDTSLTKKPRIKYSTEITLQLHYMTRTGAALDSYSLFTSLYISLINKLLLNIV